MQKQCINLHDQIRRTNKSKQLVKVASKAFKNKDACRKFEHGDCIGITLYYFVNRKFKVKRQTFGETEHSFDHERHANKSRWLVKLASKAEKCESTTFAQYPKTNETHPSSKSSTKFQSQAADIPEKHCIHLIKTSNQQRF